MKPLMFDNLLVCLGS